MTSGKIIIVTGPTACGKSALSVQLAGELDAEIISADSRQIYKGIPVLTAVPSVEERNGIVHHLLETFPLEMPYSAASFQTDGRRIIEEVRSRGKNVIVCGGSMLYIRALCYGLDALPDVHPEIRSDLKRRLEAEGLEALVSDLEEKDPDIIPKIDIRNPRRVIHALEICEVSGQPYSSLLGKSTMPYGEDEVVSMDLTAPRPILFDRINRRVDAMIENGALEEAERVFSLRHLNSLQTVGFNELFAYMEGKMDLDTAIGRIAKNTRVYAKKQITWLKKYPCDLTVDITAADPLETVMKYLNV